MKQYLIRLVFAVKIDGIVTECEEQVRIFSAASAAGAIRAAEMFGEECAGDVGSQDGTRISWIFKGVTGCNSLTGASTGDLICTSTVTHEDLNGFLSYVHARWRHIVNSAGIATDAEQK